MTGPDDLIILKREDGPRPGTTTVTVDAPGYTQAQFVVAQHIAGTAMEKKLLWQQIQDRADLRVAANLGEI